MISSLAVLAEISQYMKLLETGVEIAGDGKEALNRIGALFGSTADDVTQTTLDDFAAKNTAKVAHFMRPLDPEEE